MKKIHIDNTTENRIKEAARKIFYKKGYAASRTRDVAKEAGISPAMLNYYFRSKQRLFEVIMLESLSHFVTDIEGMLNDENTEFEYKVEQLVLQYIDRFTAVPELPLFILNEIRNNPAALTGKLPIAEMVKNSVFLRQLSQRADRSQLGVRNPLQFVMNILGLIVFPFIAQPVISGSTAIQKMEFNLMMQERKTLISVWVKMLLQN